MRFARTIAWCCGWLALVATAPLAAQAVRFPATGGYDAGAYATPGGYGGAPPISSGARLGAPAFDPYSGGSALGAPRGLAPASPWTTTPSAPPVDAYGGYQGGMSPGPGYGPAPGYGASPYGASPYGSSSNSLFPNGLWGGPSQDGPMSALRVFQGPRGSDTYLVGGSNPRDIGIHNFEFAVTGSMPNFLFSQQPLYITPTFALHLWDGPHSLPADLPRSAYSAFLDFFWASDPNNVLGAEAGVSVGSYSDFNTFTNRSIRVRGEGFGVLRLTPTLTAKLGVWYLNRNDLKLLPAGGLVWQPDEFTKFDILFPNPKFTRYLSTWGNTDLWWYIAGEYGGGAWTITRTAGGADSVDLNDIRIKLGLDWMTYQNIRGFAEIGYVFNRQVVYVFDPTDNFKARDTVLFSLGFAF